MKKSLLCLFVLMAQLSLGQSAPVEVNYSTINNNEYSFQYKNPNHCDYVLKVELLDLQGATCSCSLPFIESVSTGLGTLFTLKPSQPNQSISFRLRYTSQKGRLLAKPPKPFLYLFPFSKAQTHRAFQSQNIMETISGKKIPDFYGMSFQMQKGDTVFAARRGVVSEIKNQFDKHRDGVWFSSETNFVEVFHQDGTFGRYNRLKKGLIWVKEGQLIEAGEPIGIVADDTFEGNTVAQFTVHYLPKSKAFNADSYDYSYVIPTFYSTTNPAGILLQQGAFYTSDWPESIVTQEMSKRELKKWKSLKNE